jgi:hypothetical protein
MAIIVFAFQFGKQGKIALLRMAAIREQHEPPRELQVAFMIHKIEARGLAASSSMRRHQVGK